AHCLDVRCAGLWLCAPARLPGPVAAPGGACPGATAALVPGEHGLAAARLAGRGGHRGAHSLRHGPCVRYRMGSCALSGRAALRGVRGTHRPPGRRPFRGAAMSARRRAGGFTLVEVLVALAIVAVALAASIRAL